MKTRSFLLLVITIAALYFIGCSATHRARSVQASGFLKNYSQLKEGDGDRAVLSYINQAIQWKSYRKIILEPVKIYAGKDSDLRNASNEELSALANYFTAALYEELKKDYILVTSPGHDVMVVRAAITDADESEVVLDTITTIVPFGLALSTLKHVVTGSDSFVGDAQAEMEIIDSMSGARMAAAVDKRIGSKALKSKFGAWNHAKESFDYWAKQLRERLNALSK